MQIYNTQTKYELKKHSNAVRQTLIGMSTNKYASSQRRKKSLRTELNGAKPIILIYLCTGAKTISDFTILHRSRACENVLFTLLVRSRLSPFSIIVVMSRDP